MKPYFLILSLLFLFSIYACCKKDLNQVINTVLLESLDENATIIKSDLFSQGEILFAANDNSGSMLNLFAVDKYGQELKQISADSGYFSPTVIENNLGEWNIAYSKITSSQHTYIGVFNTSLHIEYFIDTINYGGTRPGFSSDGLFLTYQAFLPEYSLLPNGNGIGIWISPSDGSTSPKLLVSVDSAHNAEWPYFKPYSNEIMYFTNVSLNNFMGKHIINTKKLYDTIVPQPGGIYPSHACFNSSGSEFIVAQLLTSFNSNTGAVGAINDLKNTTTLLTQLNAIGYKEVDATKVPGQGGNGTLALSVDWSSDGNWLVFDALVADKNTSEILGVAIFTYDISSDKLRKVYGPVQLDPQSSNNYNFSLFTPRWIP